MKTRLDRSSAMERLRKHLSRTEPGQVPESERSTLAALLTDAWRDLDGNGTAVFPGWSWIGAHEVTWTPLFNGRDLTGWQHVGEGRFVIEDGVLKTDGGMGLLWFTERRLRDGVLRVVYPDAAKPATGKGSRILSPAGALSA
jgi:hypothetical protein